MISSSQLLDEYLKMMKSQSYLRQVASPNGPFRFLSKNENIFSFSDRELYNIVERNKSRGERKCHLFTCKYIVLIVC